MTYATPYFASPIHLHPNPPDFEEHASSIISQALWFYIVAHQRAGTTQETGDVADAIAILLTHCGGDLDYLALRYPGLTVDLRHLKL